MNRIKLIIASTLFCMMGYVGFSTYEKINLSEAQRFIQANIEALTQDESGVITLVQCRCHTDLNCYGGNAISFRPACSFSVNGSNGNYGDCSENNSVCQNLQ